MVTPPGYVVSLHPVHYSPLSRYKVEKRCSNKYTQFEHVSHLSPFELEMLLRCIEPPGGFL